MASVVNWTVTSDSEKIISQAEAINKASEAAAKVAEDCLHDNFVLGCTPDVIIRAINYIKDVHTTPVTQFSSVTFGTCLSTLLEIACPNYALEGKDFDFIEIDLRKRVEKKL